MAGTGARERRIGAQMWPFPATAFQRRTHGNFLHASDMGTQAAVTNEGLCERAGSQMMLSGTVWRKCAGCPRRFAVLMDSTRTHCLDCEAKRRSERRKGKAKAA